MLIDTFPYNCPKVTAVAFSDLHARLGQGGSTRVLTAVLDELQRFLEEKRPDYLFFGGDLFHSDAGGAVQLDMRLIHVVQEYFYFKLYPLVKRRPVLCVGLPHDKIYKDRAWPNTLQLVNLPLEEGKEPFVGENINIEFHRQNNLREVCFYPRGEKEPTAPWIGLWHVDVLGKSLGAGYRSEVGEDLSQTGRGASKLLLGHYHNPSEVGKHLYLGSTNHDDFNDAGSTKCFYYLEWLFDEERLIVERHTLDHLDIPRWIIVQDPAELTSELCRGNYVRLDAEIPVEKQDEFRRQVCGEWGALSCGLKAVRGKKTLSRGFELGELTPQKQSATLLEAVKQYINLTPLPPGAGTPDEALEVLKEIISGEA